jgi:hypothetical protein
MNTLHPHALQSLVTSPAQHLLRPALLSAALVSAALPLAAPEPAAAATLSNVAYSHNWAGYIAGEDRASSQYYTGATTVLSVPLPGYTSQTAGEVSSWVGIGGATSTSKDLIQAGVRQSVSGDQVQYVAWYETLPEAEQDIDMVVNPGDQVAVTVKVVHSADASLRQASDADDLWQITITDGQQRFQKVLAYASCHCSAEWIVETPEQNGQLAPLAAFELASMTQAAALVNGQAETIGQLNPTRSVLTDATGHALLTPSGIDAQGVAFRILSVVGT